jgi:26S proteasome regulatory subunit N7
LFLITYFFIEFKVYEGLYAMAVRDFHKAANLFLETVSTFTSYELMEYTQFVKYAVYSSIIALERRELHEKVVKGSEILEILHQCPTIKQYLDSLYNCHYSEFFTCLADVEQVAKKDRYLHPHYAFYVREMKIKAFGQLLESYR